MNNGEKIWFDGQLVAWDQATVHVSAHALHYGTSVFEGIRAYPLSEGPAVFCLDEHLDRLWNSCKVFRIEIPYSRKEIKDAILETIRVNKHAGCYIRPIVFRGTGAIGVDGRACNTQVSIFTLEMGKYLGAEALENGVDVAVSTWHRMAPNTYPASAKLGGQYVNSQLIAMEAHDRGLSEGIALDVNGYVSEGSGENIFVIRDGQIFTPQLSNCILDGITRRCVITLAGELGVPVQQLSLPREMLYVADEVFFSGTAAEITPIRSVDGITVGNGRRGPLTKRLMESFFELVEGKTPDRHGWLTMVT